MHELFNKGEGVMLLGHPCVSPADVDRVVEGAAKKGIAVDIDHDDDVSDLEKERAAIDERIKAARERKAKAETEAASKPEPVVQATPPIDLGHQSSNPVPVKSVEDEDDDPYEAADPKAEAKPKKK
jgi:hypothetical protein